MSEEQEGSEEDELELGGLNPPFPRTGGKFQARERIVKHFPEHDKYVEPFVGAGSIFFHKEPAEEEVISDLDAGLIDFFKLLPEVDPDTCDMNPSKSRFEDLVDEFVENGGRLKDKSKKHRVCGYLYIAKYCFSGEMRNWGYHGKKQKAVFLRENWERYRERLRRTKILRQKASTVIEKEDGQEVLFYLDPPYPSETLNTSDEKLTGYAGDHPEAPDIRELVDSIQGDWILSYPERKDIKEEFSQYNWRRVEFRYSSNVDEGGSPVGANELLISNMDIGS